VASPHSQVRRDATAEDRDPARRAYAGGTTRRDHDPEPVMSSTTIPSSPGSDERIAQGMRAQQALLAGLIARGSRQLGWKAGFGTTAWQQTFGLSGPLVGFLHEEALLPSGATVALDDWTAPRAEAELAVTIGQDIAGAALAADVAGDEVLIAAIAAIGPAIELVDLHPAPEDVTTVLAGNVYHRHVVLGPPAPELAGARLDGIVGSVHVSGTDLPPVHDLEASTGRVLDVLRAMAHTTSVHGRGLRAGDVVILGSIVPPQAVAPGGIFRYRLGSQPALELRFR